jgi:hypothetical protein
MDSDCLIMKGKKGGLFKVNVRNAACIIVDDKSKLSTIVAIPIQRSSLQIH